RDDFVVDAKRAAGDRAGEAAEVEIRAIHPLDRQPERLRRAVVLDVDRFQIVEQMRPRVPGRSRAGRRHVVAVPRRDRDGLELLEAEIDRELRKGVGDLVEHTLGVIDEIYLVDGEDGVTDAEQAGDDRVPAGLRQQAFARIDEQHGKLAIGGAGRHVTRVLLVARRVGDDEGPAWRREIAVGDVDGDALFALRL